MKSVGSGFVPSKEKDPRIGNDVLFADVLPFRIIRAVFRSHDKRSCQR